MDKEKFEKAAMEYLAGSMNKDMKDQFEHLLSDNSAMRKEFELVAQTWRAMEEISIPEPSAKMDATFYEMLSNRVSEVRHNKENHVSWVQTIMHYLWKPQLAYGLLILTIGLTAGYLLNSDYISDSINPTMVTNNEMEAVREQLVLTLLEQPSASKRLQGVNEVNKIERIDEKVIKALLKTLDNDPNVNVRLAAIESLTNYIDNPKVREGLVQSIVHQDTPIVQVTLANLMVALQEKRSIESFKTLMRSKDLDTTVKQKLETSIQSII